MQMLKKILVLRRAGALLFAISMFAFALPASASVLTGTIVVSVEDQDTGQVIVGATVSLSPGGMSTSSDSSGVAVFPAIPAGTYSVSASKSGYVTDTISVVLGSGEIKSVEAELRTTYTLDTGPQYQLKNGSGSVVARFDQDGNVDVDGAITYNASSGQLAATSGKELLIKSGSTIVARLDASGNLYLKGNFHRRLSSISLGSAQAFRVKNSSGTTVAAIDENGNMRILGGSNGF